jgi:hypothetical protein
MANVGITTLKILLAGILYCQCHPICTVCESALTVEHLLIHCTKYAVIRRKYFGSPPTLHELLKKIPTQKFIDFIKEAGVYFKI